MYVCIFCVTVVLNYCRVLGRKRRETGMKSVMERRERASKDREGKEGKEGKEVRRMGNRGRKEDRAAGAV